MKQRQLDQFTIVSTYQSNRSKTTNRQIFNLVESYLKGRGASYKKLIGSYKGQKERSFLLTDIELAASIARSHNQESVLHRDADNSDCYLCHIDSETSDINLGPMVAVSKKEARSQDAWSYDPSTKTYYICKGE